MLFCQLLLTALGVATAAFSAIIPRCGNGTLSGQLSANANGPLERKDPDRDPKFLTTKSHKFVVNGTGVPEVDFDLGESYAGRLPVAAPSPANSSSQNDLFFWFFPSKNPAAINEVTVFLNGGPGCSSMDGLLQENGPFLWQPGTFSPQRNPFSWTNLTNMVWIDQPIGTGLSSADPGAGSLIKDEHDVAVHFAGFWKNFIDTFDMHGYDVYLTGESYAGMMIPYIADHFLEQADDEYYNVKGIYLIDPAIGPLALTEHAPAAQFLSKHASYFNLNDTFSEYITGRALECGYAGYMLDALTFPPAGKIAAPHSFDGQSVNDNCTLWLDIAQAAVYVNPCFNAYHITDFCPFPSSQLGFPTLGWGPNNYFNRSDVQDALNVHEPRPSFKVCEETSFGLEGSEPSAFTVLPSVVERTGNVVIANGDLDFLLTSDGTLAVINNMTWQGVQGFEESPLEENFYVPYNPTIGLAMDQILHQSHVPTIPVGYVGGGGYYGKTHTERGLTFVTVAMAGHEIPQYVPGAAYRQLEFLLGRVDNLTSIGDFTTTGPCDWL